MQTVADTLERYADAGNVGGFNISPYLTPTGLDDIVDRLVPELQNRGVYPSEYAGTTLLEHLGLDPELP
ncbi:alkanesulfonate monooxygenase SsuD/methylene tetrahydromethanopterin reductase-like flavin-dependent oxidoreductase (luciferase family) [Pseudoclavibacter chungangensis]|nr:alkanesulfonate monooxygenase SsuD/methylene tetrahydromethanopterin reductase-like flavin-dependent oxidoreductase (luciferase family) [Pseudoclavibacter chungangensis]